MKKLLLTVIFCLLLVGVQSQTLTEINQNRIDRTKKGMMVLGSWAAVNLISSPILRNQASGSEKYFHEMNGYWNAVNLAIAGLGYYRLSKENASNNNLKQTIGKQQQIEKTLLFNTGLDLAYIAGGFYLKERGVNKNDDRLHGFGDSLILQGAFLATFDIIFYLFQRKGSKQIDSLLENITLEPNGVRLSINLN